MDLQILDRHKLLNLLLKSVEIGQSSSLFEKKIKITSNSMKINDLSIEFNKFQKKFILIIGKGISGLLTYLLTKKEVITNFEIIVLIPNKEHIPQSVKNNNITLLYGNHPIPNNDSFDSTELIIKKLFTLKTDDLAIFFISGGTSSLFSFPHSMFSKDEFRTIWTALLHSNISIKELNISRGIIDQVKKGGVNNFTKAQIFGFYLSDVVNDDLSTIGSGPTVQE